MATHRLSRTPLHMIWCAMRQRCKNTNYQTYRLYGGRGIKVCERWDSFEAFVADMGPRPSDLHSLDRVNNDGNYEPSNCRWATKHEQAFNRSTNRLYEYRGLMMSIAAAVDMAGSIVKPMIARGRIYSGWSVRDAVETPNVFYRDPVTKKVIGQEFAP